MTSSKLRRMIAWQAARMMYLREETEYYRAKMKAAKAIHRGWVKPADLPSNAEIRDQVRSLAIIHEGHRAEDTLFEMRVEALCMMRRLQRFHPRLIGSVLTGHIRHGSDIDLHLFVDSVESIRGELEYHGIVNDLIEKRISKAGVRKLYRHLIIQDRFTFELTVYSPKERQTVFKSSITGKPIERASLAEWEIFMKNEYPNVDLEAEVVNNLEKVDPLAVFYSLLLPMEDVIQHRKYHPEGDALYHSLQVFDLACDLYPYDEEFLLAALLHDVGKGIDSQDHVNAGLEAVGDMVTDRTRWLIAHHMDAHKAFDQTLGSRAHKRLREHECYNDLMALQECDRLGRASGMVTTSLEDAMEYIRTIRNQFR